MKFGLYLKLALVSIRKNKKTYVPFILTAMGMVMMGYIIAFIANDPGIATLSYATVMQSFLTMGTFIILVFSTVFLFYTNSFLVKRRKKEFGLYNILGMDKGNLSKILFWEILLMAAFSIGGGLGLGILFSRLAQLIVIKVVGGGEILPFAIETNAVNTMVVSFAFIFLLLLLRGIWQIYKAKPVELLQSETVGEKPPKANWLGALIGLILLIIAYGISISLRSPMIQEKILLITLAVILVIIATYLLFIAGSVAFLKILQKNKNYYYKTNHFVSVSSMIYRMKRNGAGLASICVLSIMVLVLMTTTVSLYAGKENNLREMYPRDMMVDVFTNTLNNPLDKNYTKEAIGIVEKTIAEEKVDSQNILNYHFYEVLMKLNKSQGTVDLQGVNPQEMTVLTLISLEDYNRITNSQETLEEGEGLAYSLRMDYPFETFEIEGIEGLETVEIKKHLKEFPKGKEGTMNLRPYLYIVLLESTLENFGEKLFTQYEARQYAHVEHQLYGFDMGEENGDQLAFYQKLSKKMDAFEGEGKNPTVVKVSGAAKARGELFGMYGAILFLGAFLSIVFLMATVLTMYYKQINEGYEDQKKFEIMQKVGMTKKEIKKTINSQVLTVFFLPLLFAGIHLLAAFNFIKELLLTAGLANIFFIIKTTLICYCIFALLYVIMYKITSKAYFDIVSGELK